MLKHIHLFSFLPSSFITLPSHFSSLLYLFLILILLLLLLLILLLHLLSVISSSSLIPLLSFSSLLLFLLHQGTYSIARSAGAVMFTSNVRAKFDLPEGDVITETLFGLNLVPDDSVLQNRSVVMGFDCGVPPEPSVCDNTHNTDTAEPS